MSTTSYPMADTATMLRRNLRHALRYPGLSLGALGMPVIMMLLFGLIFGDTFSAGTRRRQAASTTSTSSPRASC